MSEKPASSFERMVSDGRGQFIGSMSQLYDAVTGGYIQIINNLARENQEYRKKLGLGDKVPINEGPNPEDRDRPADDRPNRAERRSIEKRNKRAAKARARKAA